MILYVIRHGETYWNKEHKLQGQQGTDLDSEGIRLAAITARGMRDIHLDFCISSPLIRARHTAEIITAGRGIPILEDERIEEIAFGEWEGKHCLAPDIEIPEDRWSVFFSDPFHYIPPRGGESIRDVINRTGNFIREITTDPGNRDKSILISTHGCAMRAMLNPFYKNPKDFWHGGVPKNCALSEVVVRNGKAVLTVSDHTYYEGEEDPWQAIYSAEKKKR
ncbi:MAG: histidine phosphatase family protein [Bilifractor sp.]|jgi:broad specificity phosphatase PhoE